MTKEAKGLLNIHISVFLSGTAGLFGKLLDLSPTMIVFGRALFAAVALLLYKGILLCSSNNDKKQSFLKVAANESKRTPIITFSLIMALGVTLAIHWITFFHSIQLSTVSLGLLSFSTFPIYVVFLEPLLFRTSFKISHLFYALITLAGVWLLVPEYSWGNSSFQGVFWGVFSGFSYAVVTLLNKYLTRKYSAVSLTLFQNGIAFLVLLPFALRSIAVGISLSEWLILVLLGVVFTAISHSLFIFGLKSIKAHVAGIISCMESVYGILFAFLILAEVPNLRTIAGGIVILSVTIVMSMSKDYACRRDRKERSLL